jgi:peroxiredoxin
MNLCAPFCGACSSRAPAHGAEQASATELSTSDASSTAPALPDAPLQDLDGKATPLASFLHGRAALVSFWATWCDACYAEMDALNRLSAQANARSGAVVVGVAVGEDRLKVADFARSRGLMYPLLVDSDFALSDGLGERRVPSTLVVDRSGHIAYRGGALDAAALEAFRNVVQKD